MFNAVVANKLENQISSEERVIRHLFIHHGIKIEDEKGWIALCKKTEDKFTSHHYRLKDINLNVVKDYMDGNFYFSQNTFWLPWRSVENLRNLMTLYVDVDCYTMGHEPEKVAEIIIESFSKSKFPLPNRIVFSGRGLVPVWDIVPAPHYALPLWQAITHYLVNTLKPYGSDPHATDAARIFRPDGSINMKNGSEVTVMYIHEERKNLDYWRDTYLPELPKKNEKPKKGRPSEITRMYNSYSLHYNRLMDLIRLVEMRKGKMSSAREKTLFLYRYWQCDYTKNTELALENTLQFNKKLKPRLSEKEVEYATKSAEKMFEKKLDEKAREQARAKGFPDAGYNYTNAALIKLLSITEDEQKQLKTIISKKEKQRRNTLEKRKNRGSVTRKEYLERQADRTQNQLRQLQEAMEKYPNAKRKELAAMLEVDPSYITRLKKKLKM